MSEHAACAPDSHAGAIEGDDDEAADPGDGPVWLDDADLYGVEVRRVAGVDDEPPDAETDPYSTGGADPFGVEARLVSDADDDRRDP